MTAARILNQAQAEAVYSAMCALNRVRRRSTLIDIGLPNGEEACIVIRTNGTIAIWQASHGEEAHHNIAAFATAYGLSSDAAPAVCSECGGRGVVDAGIGLMSCGSCPA